MIFESLVAVLVRPPHHKQGTWGRIWGLNFRVVTKFERKIWPKALPHYRHMKRLN
jgi:hypothetical protein